MMRDGEALKQSDDNAAAAADAAAADGDGDDDDDDDINHNASSFCNTGQQSPVTQLMYVTCCWTCW